MESRVLFETACHNELFNCPILLVQIQDPVITPQGTTYERNGIKEWLNINRTDPLDRSKLENNQLLPNHLYTHINALRSSPLTQLKQLRKLLCCPLTGKIFTDPVVTIDGYTYERTVIEPFTKMPALLQLIAQPLPLYPNTFIKDLLEDQRICQLIDEANTITNKAPSRLNNKITSYLNKRKDEPFIKSPFGYTKTQKFFAAMKLARGDRDLNEGALNDGRLGKIAEPLLKKSLGMK